ncbi:Hypothetical predicted protein [Olea europaea subsp. europaea]|uniref:Uncharacterized protein n=1 Tax=Olea europaea subsp. europaea TaxID=158383 RepID=A0A8S0PLP1_OLEEU|nr:Hypothetical predicted protein [Olea europaea subsp. europaea]
MLRDVGIPFCTMFSLPDYIVGLKRALSTANSSQSEAEQHQRNGDPITGTSAQATEHPDLPYGDSEIGK